MTPPHQPADTFVTTPCTRLSSAAFDSTSIALFAMTWLVSLAVLITPVRWSNASNCRVKHTYIHTDMGDVITHASKHEKTCLELEGIWPLDYLSTTAWLMQCSLVDRCMQQLQLSASQTRKALCRSPAAVLTPLLL